VVDWLQEKIQASKDLPKEFPGLKRLGFGVKDVTSRKTTLYNCIAYAAKDESRPWWPMRQRPGMRYYFWPDHLKRVSTVSNFLLAFQWLGFEVCASGEHEAGYEKVALYVNENDEPKHMARELGDGVWYSKLGDEQDIRQHTLTAIENDRYGTAAYYLRKPLPDKGTLPVVKV